MLFPYIYVPHQMEKMHKFINFIFYQVWCRAAKTGGFDLSLFDANPGLKEVMTSLFYDHTIPGDHFYKQVEDIYQEFSNLSREQIAQLKRWYQGNNDLRKICCNDPTAHLARYADLELIDKGLADKVAIFFKGIYSQQLLGLAALRAKIGDIDSHYKAFVSTNRKGKCPFCGISDLQGEYHSTREAYDHYLPKSLYPFNSINFQNLVPACHLCNSSYKTTKNPAYSPKDPAGITNRRKIFYPFSERPQPIELEVTIRTKNVEKLAPEDITLVFGPVGIRQEIETWKSVYGIEERYKAKICSESDGKYWLTQVLDEWQQDGKDPKDFMLTLARLTTKNSYADCNFLKKPFLDACQVAGIF
jgi:hypothetical protein